MYITAKPGDRVNLGHEGENLARTIRFDISQWKAMYGDGVVALIHQREGDDNPYPCAIAIKGDIVEWVVTNADTEKPGQHGKYELQYRFGEGLSKTCTGTTCVFDALGDPMEKAPEAGKDWLDNILGAGAVAEAAKLAAEAAQAAAEAAKLSAEEAQAGAKKEASASAESASAARGSADRADAAAVAAGTYEQKASEFASAAAKSESDAASSKEAAALSAKNAAGSEQNAKNSAETAQQSAKTAKQNVESALQEAKDSGEFDGYTPVKGKDYFDGKDGVSATHSWSGTVLTVTSASGTSSADLKGGKGDDGVSPTVQVSQQTNGAKVTITDKDGEQSFTISNGKSVYAHIYEVPAGHIVNLEDAAGEHIFEVKDGYTPVKGEDYWTEEDKQALVNDVLNAMPTWEGGSF